MNAKFSNCSAPSRGEKKVFFVNLSKKSLLYQTSSKSNHSYDVFYIVPSVEKK